MSDNNNNSKDSTTSDSHPFSSPRMLSLHVELQHTAQCIRYSELEKMDEEISELPQNISFHEVLSLLSRLEELNTDFIATHSYLKDNWPKSQVGLTLYDEYFQNISMKEEALYITIRMKLLKRKVESLIKKEATYQSRKVAQKVTELPNSAIPGPSRDSIPWPETPQTIKTIPHTARKPLSSIRGTTTQKRKLIDSIASCSSSPQAKTCTPKIARRAYKRRTRERTPSPPPRYEYCNCCEDQDHFIVNCPQFMDLTVAERWQLVETLFLCPNCYGEHELMNCRSQEVCKACYKRHHTLLHESSMSSESDISV